MPFAYTDPPQGVTIFQRHLNDIRAAKRAEKEPRMLTKSVSDVAWAAVSAAAWELVQRKKAETFEAAVDQLKQQSHPSYLTYLASLAPGSAPLPEPSDIGKRAAAVVTQSEETHFAKRRQVMTEVNKRATALVRSGQAATEQEGIAAVFKADPALYEQYRQASYSTGPGVPPAPPDVATVTAGPVYDQVRKMALALKQQADPWGQYAGKSEHELVQEVFTRHPELFTAYRNESYNRG